MVYFKEGKINRLCVYFFKETYLLQSSKDTNRPGNLFSSLITKSKPQMFAKKKTCLQLFKKKKNNTFKTTYNCDRITAGCSQGNLNALYGISAAFPPLLGA